MIRGDEGIRPGLGARASVDASARVIEDVELGDDASVWMSCLDYEETYRAEAEEGR